MFPKFVSSIVLVNLAISVALTSAAAANRRMTKRQAPMPSLVNLNNFANIDAASLVKLLQPVMDASELNQAIVPVTAKLLMAPLGIFSEVASRTAMLMMITAYSAADIIPSAITRIESLDSPLVARLVDPAISEDITPIINALSHAGEVRTFMDQMLSHVGMDNVQCKAVLARRAGQFLLQSFPTMGGFMSTAAYPLTNDGFVRLMLDSMNEPSPKADLECEALDNMSKYWDEIQTQNVAEVVRDALRNAVAHALARLSPTLSSEPAATAGLKGTAYETAGVQLERNLKVRALQLALEAARAAL